MEYAIGFILGMITMWLAPKIWKWFLTDSDKDELLAQQNGYKKQRDVFK